MATTSKTSQPPNSSSMLNRIQDKVRLILKKPTPASSLRESLDSAIDEVIGDVIEDRKSSVEDLRAEERMMFQNIIRFGGIKVVDVMVPRADIVGIEIETPIQELLEVFHEAAHSRMPVYRENLDDPIGMVHIKDLIGWLAENDGGASNETNDVPSISKLKREVLFVPPSMPIIDLLIRMQTTRIHMAIVIDEYGGTDGLVTIEDLVEQIVGQIEDEHDTDESPTLHVRSRGRIDADARVPIDELEQLIDRELCLEDKEEDIDTLGGLVFSLAGRIPQRGELIAHPEAAVDFEVVDADPRRIKSLKIFIKDPQKGEGQDDTANLTNSSTKPTPTNGGDNNAESNKGLVSVDKSSQKNEGPDPDSGPAAPPLSQNLH